MSHAKVIFHVPFEDLAKRFNLQANVSIIFFPASLHAEFIKTYLSCHAMAQKLDSILECPDHRIFIEEGRRLFFDLPNPDFLNPELALLRSSLQFFSPFKVQKIRKDQVGLFRQDIQGLFSVFAQSLDIGQKIFDMFKQTQYLECMRYMRDVQHTPYTGPSSLQEVFRTFIGVHRANQSQKAYLQSLQGLSP